METKKSKVINVFLKREGDGKYGHYYIHGITFDNGDTGDYMAKSNPQKYFVVGQEADYTKETTQNGNYTNIIIKPVQPQGGNGGKGFFGGSPTAQNKRTALECAVSLAVAGKIPFEQIGSTAQKYVAWLNLEPQAPQPTVKPEPVPAKSAEPFLPPSTDDDLPF